MAPVLFLFYMQATIEAVDRDWPVAKPDRGNITNLYSESQTLRNSMKGLFAQ